MALNAEFCAFHPRLIAFFFAAAAAASCIQVAGSADSTWGVGRGLDGRSGRGKTAAAAGLKGWSQVPQRDAGSEFDCRLQAIAAGVQRRPSSVEKGGGGGGEGGGGRFGCGFGVMCLRGGAGILGGSGISMDLDDERFKKAMRKQAASKAGRRYAAIPECTSSSLPGLLVLGLDTHSSSSSFPSLSFPLFPLRTRVKIIAPIVGQCLLISPPSTPIQETMGCPTAQADTSRAS
jgi:hypothetical protein